MTSSPFHDAASSAETLGQEWLIAASKAAREAQQARANGDHSLADLLDEQSERAYSEVDKCEGRVRWYRGHAWMAENMPVRVKEAAE